MLWMERNWSRRDERRKKNKHNVLNKPNNIQNNKNMCTIGKVNASCTQALTQELSYD